MSHRRLRFLQIDFPHRLYHPTGDTLRDPPDVVEDFHRERVGFLLRNSRPIEPNTGRHRALPRDVVVALYTGSARETRRIIGLYVDRSGASFHPSYCTFYQGGSGARARPQKAVELPKTIIDYHSFLPPTTSTHPRRRSTPPK